MDHGGNSSPDEDRSIHDSEITEMRLDVGEIGSSGKIFRPEPVGAQSPEPVGPPTSAAAVPAPEKKLTLFALRLAVLEKFATRLGSLGFVWATVVLLGGFAISLDTTDFWIVSVILVIEGARIFSRSHELEFQHQSTYTITGINSFRSLISSSRFLVKQVIDFFHRNLNIGRDRTEGMSQETARGQMSSAMLTHTRTWKSSDVPILPYPGWIFVPKNVSKVFYFLQLLSASTCVILSLMKLIKRNYGANGPEKTNLYSALTIFYALAFAEASLFLVEKAYWEWKVSVSKILENVNEECGLEKFGTMAIRRFFYDAYSRCINGSIFDGLKMDMVSFAMELLESNSPDEQLIGAEILCRFSKNEDYASDTLQKIGMNSETIERLLEILNWKNPQQEDIRLLAAEILSRLASKKKNCLRVAGIPGAIESISSLLESTRILSETMDEIGERKINHGERSYDSWMFSNIGLLILKRLARDHDNCGKIGKTRGLISKIIDFTHAEKRVLENPNPAESRILAVERSLKLIKKLVSSTGTTGKSLRRDISSVVFTVCNIREILRHGERHSDLQKLGTEILTFLSLDEGATERIGGTGGILKELVCIFLKDDIAENRRDIRVSTGDAIAMLAQGSRNNCHQILKLNVIPGLVRALDKPRVRSSAARILRNLCAYTAPEFHEQLQEVKSAGVWVSFQDKILEVMVGLAPHILRLMSSEESRTAFKNASVSEEEVAEELVKILEKYKYPSSRVPRIRRFAIELTIQMMETSPETVKTFRDLGMKTELETVSETATELENFDIFSGTVGIARHGSSINELVEAALQLLATR
ncbi:PREDICTED: uncharacterized protein LOC104808657 [Tarenaya hassleriana]|uniref:uncharacterized protein LOC104808657 n=1 Tax=Tarenaya hassleriana TaxID=28532 RepID=UPI00053C4738|nr:PREDICTED: uncharacterized protein LOC104808657 [Tarenaya hassleriana]